MGATNLFAALVCALAALGSSVGLVVPVQTKNSPHHRDTRAAPTCLYTKSWEPINNPSVLIPLYTNPWQALGDANTCTHKYYLDVAKGCKAVTAVVNPNTGPFSLDHWQISGLKSCMRMLSANNVMMVGYVYTKIAKMDPATGIWSTSGMRDMSEVARDMDRWVSIAQGLPNFRGFFLDDTTNYYQILYNAFGVDHLWWYRTLVNMGKQKLPNAQIVLNPGSFTDLRLMRADPANGYPVAAEITIPFEDYAWRWRPANNDCGSFKTAAQAAQGSFGPGPWCANVPNWDHVEPFKEAVARREFKASAMVHSASREFAFNEVSVAQSNGFKYFYVSDVALVDGPWGQVPKFWDEYLTYLNNAEGGSSTVTGCDAPGTSLGPFASGCLQKWWQAAGCTISGSSAPKYGDPYWYSMGTYVTISQIKADFNEYARLAALNTPTYRQKCGTAPTSCAAITDTTIGPFPPGCISQWWVAAGCSSTGTVAPKIDTVTWYRSDLTAGQIKNDFNEYARLAKAGTSGYAAMCGSSCSVSDTAIGPFPAGCMSQWWASAGCTPAGTVAPKTDTQMWYRADMTAAQVKTDFNEYARLARAGTGAFPSMCGIGCSVADTATGPFPSGCMAQWWTSAGCTARGTVAPKIDAMWWYRSDLTAAQVKADFNEYARLAKAGSGTFPAMCGL